MGIFAERKARREAAEARAAAEREACAREAGLSVDELLHEWHELLAASGVETSDVATVDASGGSLWRPDASGWTFVDRGLVLVTQAGQLVLVFRPLAPGDEAPSPVEVIVRPLTEVRETRQKEDRSFLIVFEGDGLFRPPNNPMRGDAWELRHPDPEELYRHFLSLGLPW